MQCHESAIIYVRCLTQYYGLHFAHEVIETKLDTRRGERNYVMQSKVHTQA